MNNTRTIIGAIIVIIGISSLFGFQLFRFLIPVFIIYVGFMVLSGNKWPSQETEKSKNTASDINDFVLLTGVNRIVESTQFKGGKVTAILGGADLDLSRVKTTEKIITMEVTAVLGGVKLRVPDNWRVTSDAVAVMGGIGNKTRSEKDSKVELKITGISVMGGIELTN